MSEEPMEEGTLAKLIDSYIKLRDKKEALVKEQRVEVKKLDEIMEGIEAFLRAHLKQQKVQSISSDFGTAFINRQRSATLADTAMFREFVIANSNFDLADFRPKKDAVEAYIEEHGGRTPPGVNFSTREVVLVQRK
jgi:hypothetical protein